MDSARYILPVLTQNRPIDTLTTYHVDKVSGTVPAPVRYAVRQVLDQEYQKEKILRASNARQARAGKSDAQEDAEEAAVVHPLEKVRPASGVKRDFFGRVIKDARTPSAGTSSENNPGPFVDAPRVWVHFSEGYSNAVRKPLTLKELLDSF